VLFLSTLCLFGALIGATLTTPERPPEIQERRNEYVDLWEAPAPATPPPEVQALKDRMRQAAERVEALPADAGPRPFDVRITEDEVNAALATDPRIRAELERQGARRVTILFDDGRAMIDGIVEMGGMEAPVTADAVPTVRPDGTIDVAIENAQAGIFPLPASLMNKVRSKLEDLLRQQDPERGRITGITMQDGVLTLRGEITGDLPSADELREMAP
jgi:hypothetical protein